jgi:hypothetical protein
MVNPVDLSSLNRLKNEKLEIMNITRETILELKKKISEVTSEKNSEICPDYLFPVTKGKKKTSALLGELDDILREAKAKTILIEDIPEVLDNIENICNEIETRIADSKGKSGGVNSLIELEKETRLVYGGLEELINEKIGKFI